jgi:hypothetical protein
MEKTVTLATTTMTVDPTSSSSTPEKSTYESDPEKGQAAFPPSPHGATGWTVKSAIHANEVSARRDDASDNTVAQSSLVTAQKPDDEPIYIEWEEGELVFECSPGAGTLVNSKVWWPY